MCNVSVCNVFESFARLSFCAGPSAMFFGFDLHVMSVVVSACASNTGEQQAVTTFAFAARLVFLCLWFPLAGTPSLPVVISVEVAF